DVFSPYIGKIESITDVKYTGSYNTEDRSDIAFRVVSDHLRAVVFAIADGQLPSNTGAGYVIRRILRRAVRYYYSFLDTDRPLLVKLVPVMIDEMGHVFPEIKKQKDLLMKVIEEEESSFLKTLENGLKILEQVLSESKEIDGETAFEMYDTYGFPIDLTELIAQERNASVDIEGFRQALSRQKERSRADAKKEVHDWVIINEGSGKFVGYDQLEVTDAHILRYRRFSQKDKSKYQIILDKNPFYAEGGGQVGDTGWLIQDDEKIRVIDTQRENELFLLITEDIFTTPASKVQAKVDTQRRRLIENNHSATHLLHAALREILGDHVQQKGSLVKDDYLRFDFSHFSKLTDEEILSIERLVNSKIRDNIKREEAREIPLEEAKEAGAIMLFGEKYGDEVRMITFDDAYSRELCGGCHVDRTGDIGLFKITNETSVAAGVRRIEAVTAIAAERHVEEEENTLRSLQELFKSGGDLELQVRDVIEVNRQLQDKIRQLQSEKSSNVKSQLENRFESIDGLDILAEQVDIADAKVVKDLIYQLEKSRDGAAILFGFVSKGKPQLMLRISEEITERSALDAGKIVRDLGKRIKGGGGGQPFFATAGGSDASGISEALEEGKKIIIETYKKMAD
ncbi:MAG: alanine--tRNA ligase, partial [Saprospiraceae bacterium]|nr:alanine--tRNA ligase [Saprospiraceae bacterium]